MKYEALLQEAASKDIYIIENADFDSSADALINGDVIGLNKNINEIRKRTCVLAEELGHYHTTVGNILDQSEVNERKQEVQARAWAYNRLIGLDGIIEAYTQGCRDLCETAEYLEVTEEFLSDAILYYKSKFGTHVKTDGYIIFFEPSIAVLERKTGILLKSGNSAG
ncbi:MAG: ImmA/IrrE family metallo-endopeptidase [Lachnospiraceae bacterium]|nr:ImmA/IrrE family metallo-endopeptidase [Lachnospiraceae bacterium]